jgi:hypothetical protein
MKRKIEGNFIENETNKKPKIGIEEKRKELFEEISWLIDQQHLLDENEDRDSGENPIFNRLNELYDQLNPKLVKNDFTESELELIDQELDEINGQIIFEDFIEKNLIAVNEKEIYCTSACKKISIKAKITRIPSQFISIPPYIKEKLSSYSNGDEDLACKNFLDILFNNISKLEAINLEDNNITDFSIFTKNAFFKNIKNLSIVDPLMDNQKLLFLSGMKYLKSLEISSCDGKVTAFPSLKNGGLKELEELYLYRTKTSSILFLKELKNIKRLSLCDNELGDIFSLMVVVDSLKKLNWLDLSDNPLLGDFVGEYRDQTSIQLLLKKLKKKVSTEISLERFIVDKKESPKLDRTFLNSIFSKIDNKKKQVVTSDGSVSNDDKMSNSL